MISRWSLSIRPCLLIFFSRSITNNFALQFPNPAPQPVASQASSRESQPPINPDSTLLSPGSTHGCLPHQHPARAPVFTLPNQSSPDTASARPSARTISRHISCTLNRQIPITSSTSAAGPASPRQPYSIAYAFTIHFRLRVLSAILPPSSPSP